MLDLEWLRYTTDNQISIFYESGNVGSFFHLCGMTNNYENLPTQRTIISGDIGIPKNNTEEFKLRNEATCLCKNLIKGYYSIISQKPTNIIELVAKYIDLTEIKVAPGALDCAHYLIKFNEEIEKQKKLAYLKGLKVELIKEGNDYVLIGKNTDPGINENTILFMKDYGMWRFINKDTDTVRFSYANANFWHALKFAEKFNMDVTVNVPCVDTTGINEYLQSKRT